MKKTIIILVSIFIFIGILKFMIFTSSAYSDKSSVLKFGISDRYYTYALDIPANLTFAGESVPLHMFDVRERLDRELLVNSYWQSQTLLMMKRAHRWFPVIEPILKKYNIPDDFKYLAVAESGLMNVISPAGATGYWQFLTSSGKQFGLEISNEIDERYHMEKSTEAACKYLNEAYRKTGSWTLAAACYNMGIDGVRKQLDKQKVNSYYDLLLNEETSRYVFRLITLREIFQSPKKYGYNIRKKDLYPLIPTYTVTIDSSISNLVDFAVFHGTNFKVLRLLNPWLRQNSLVNKEKKTFAIKLPDSKFNYDEYFDQFSEETLDSIF